MPKQDDRIKQDADDKKLGQKLKRQGFDKSYWNSDSGGWRVRCSQCEAMTINGVATHEYGCPNHRRG